ncbi:MAG: hypothetical protein K9W43_12460 [Candidatus Thorarchaeota archaeon]|nr:hypothetical protein [Candidatus Thorarchaeota archaeon]
MFSIVQSAIIYTSMGFLAWLEYTGISVPIMAVIMGFWHYWIYPVYCIEKQVIPHVQERLSIPEETIDYYRTFIRTRKRILFVWGLASMFFGQLIWSWLSPWAVSLWKTYGMEAVWTVPGGILILAYFTILGTGGAIITKYLRRREDENLREIFVVEDKWLDVRKMIQSI